MRYNPMRPLVWCFSKNLTFAFSSTRFGAFCGYAIHPTAKVSERTNRNVPARNTLVQLLALYTDSESHSAQRHGQTDRQTTGFGQLSIIYCVAVRSADKNTVRSTTVQLAGVQDGGSV